MAVKDKKEWLYKNKTRLRRNIDKAIEKGRVDVETLEIMKKMLDVVDQKGGVE